LLDFRAEYEETSTTALSANPAVVVPLLTISGWIVVQRKVTGGSVSFIQTWAAYRDGFGSATVNDNYWLGLDKVYRLMQLGSARLRIEAKLQLLFRSTSHSYYRVGKKRDRKHMAIILSNLNRFKNIFTGRFFDKCAVTFLLELPPHLAYVATLQCTL